MLLQENKVNVERSANFAETGFKIKASAKAFKILSSGLYSDKIKAIVRELGTNAADSHVMANKADRQFRVHLPNALEPWFSIRDFGTGLSASDIEGIYTTYFESNKSQNNDVTGCLGLGSKSPFSYTDNFTITSYFNGKRLTYTAFMNEYGLPAVANLAEEDTQEENGVQVEFPVEAKDYFAFREKAELVYSYFKVQPEIVGQTVKLANTVADYSGSNWKLFRNNASHRLVMGNVAYPLCLSSSDCMHELFRNVGIEIECKIGEAEMTASREALEYTERTKEVVRKATAEAVENWTKLVLAELEAQPTYWDACLFYIQNRLWIKQGTEWKGRKLRESIRFSHGIHCSICKPHFGTRVNYKVNQYLDEIHVNNDTMFIEDDLERGTKLRAMQYVRNNGYKGTMYIVTFTDAAEKQWFADELGIPLSKISRTSALPKVVRTKNPNAGKKVIFSLDTGGHNNRTYWDTVPLAGVTGGLYVELDKWQVKGYANAGSLSSMVNIIKKAGYNIEVFGVRKNVIKKIAANPNWVRLEDKIAEIQLEHDADKQYILNYSNYMQYEHLKIFKNAVNGIDINDIVDKIEYVAKNKAKFERLLPIMRKGAKDTDWSVPALDAIKKKYPLLFFIMENHASHEWPVSKMVEYVQMVNKV